MDGQTGVCSPQSGEVMFVEAGVELFCMRPNEGGTYTVALGKDITWDGAGRGFWEIVRELAPRYNAKVAW